MTDMTDHEIDAAMAIRADEDAEITSLRAERDALKAGAATVTWGDADITIASLVAERDAAQQENIRLREALQEVYDAFWQAKLEVRYPHANKLAEDILYTASSEVV
jgi:hypothetical protein